MLHTHTYTNIVEQRHIMHQIKQSIIQPDTACKEESLRNRNEFIAKVGSVVQDFYKRSWRKESDKNFNPDFTLKFPHYFLVLVSCLNLKSVFSILDQDLF